MAVLQGDSAHDGARARILLWSKGASVSYRKKSKPIAAAAIDLPVANGRIGVWAVSPIMVPV